MLLILSGENSMYFDKNPSIIIETSDNFVFLKIFFTFTGNEVVWPLTNSNASDELKAVADYVTLDVDHNGVAAAINKFLLQKAS